MTTLKNTIASLADSFASGVLAAVRNASLEEILDGGGRGAPARRGPGRSPKANAGTSMAPKPAKRGNGGRLARRSPEDIAHVEGLIVATLGSHKAGLRSEQLQKLLKLSKKEIVRPLELALTKKTITKKGQRRATTYFMK